MKKEAEHYQESFSEVIEKALTKITIRTYNIHYN